MLWSEVRIHDSCDIITTNVNTCIYCKRLYGAEWDHYCTRDDLAFWHFTYEDWVTSFE